MYLILRKIIYLVIVSTIFVSLFSAQNNLNAEEYKIDKPIQPDDASKITNIKDSPLSVEECIAIALANNPEIAAAKWDIKAVDSRHDTAKSAFWPQLSVEGGYQNYTDSQRLIAARYNGEPGTFDNNLLRIDVLGRLNLFAGGRMLNEVGAAKRLFEAEKKKFIRTKDELVYAVTNFFFSVLGQQRVIDSLEFSKSSLEANRKRIEQLYDVQKAAKVDLLRIDVRLSDINQSIIKEKNTLAIQKHALLNLMGSDTAPGDFRLLDKADTPSESSFDLEGLIETALKNRPDYLAAKDRLEAQNHRVNVAKAGHLPNVNVVGSYGIRNAPTPNDIGTYPVTKEKTKLTEYTGFIGIVVSVPLFEGGRITAKVDEEIANLIAAQYRLKRLELQIRQETEAAFLDILSNTSRFRATEKSVEQAKESMRIESLKYELGRGSITDVLDSQAALLQAETSNCRACIDYHISKARLKLATGGGL